MQWVELKQVVGIAACLCATAVLPQATHIVEIEHLMDYIEQSECRFERNGELYDSEEAAAHIADKYRYLEEKIATAEQFIRYAATRSSITGNRYLVHCGDRKPVSSSVWLKRELEQFRRTRG